MGNEEKLADKIQNVKVFVFGGWAKSVVEPKTLDAITPYAYVQCQVTKYIQKVITNLFMHQF